MSTHESRQFTLAIYDTYPLEHYFDLFKGYAEHIGCTVIGGLVPALSYPHPNPDSYDALIAGQGRTNYLIEEAKAAGKPTAAITIRSEIPAEFSQQDILLPRHFYDRHRDISEIDTPEDPLKQWLFYVRTTHNERQKVLRGQA